MYAAKQTDIFSVPACREAVKVWFFGIVILMCTKMVHGSYKLSHITLFARSNSY